MFQNGSVYADEIRLSYRKDHSTSNSVKTSGDNSDIIVRDDRFIMYSNGVVFDTRTRLEWFAGPDEAFLWMKARKWVDRLKVAGGGWRMPTVEELETLHQKGVGTRNITPLLKTTGFWLWSGEIKEPAWAWGFAIYHGVKDWLPRDYHTYGRVFAVRFAP